MKVTTITFGRKIGLPNYSSVNIEMTAALDETDDYDEAFTELRQKVDDELRLLPPAPPMIGGGR